MGEKIFKGINVIKNVKMVRGENKQSNQEFYPNSNYEIPKTKFITYWHQIHEVQKTKPKKFLEIGIGDGFVSNYLGKKKKIKVVTFDNDKKLNPDFVGDINFLSKYFPKNSFDTILCAEVLEHLPFSSFKKCLKEMNKISKKKCNYS